MLHDAFLAVIWSQHGHIWVCMDICVLHSGLTKSQLHEQCMQRILQTQAYEGQAVQTDTETDGQSVKQSRGHTCLAYTYTGRQTDKHPDRYTESRQLKTQAHRR